jgi:hypothetical protein
MGDEAKPSGTQPSERRVRPDLRKLFPEVVRCVEPFFGKSAARLGGSLDYWAAREIHELFPELDPQDVRTLLSAAARVHRGGGSFTE